MKRISWIITLGAQYDKILRSSLCEDCSKSSSGPYRKEFLWLRLRGSFYEEIELEDLDLSRYWAWSCWQQSRQISPSQIKDESDVLRSFGRINCKHLSTQMISNLKILRDQVTNSDPNVLTLKIIDSSYIHENRHLVYAKCSQKHLHTVTVNHILRLGLRNTSCRGKWLHGLKIPD